PRLDVKPRAHGVQPSETAPGEEPPAAASPPPSTPLPAPPAGGGLHAAPPFDADAADEPDVPQVTPIDLDDADDEMEVYAALVGQLRMNHALAAGRIEHDAYLVSLDHDALVVGVLAPDLDALAPDLDRLRRIARAAIGNDYGVRAEALGRGDARLDETRNLYRRRTRREAAERHARCEAARRDPMVMLVSEALDAAVIEINPN
ncbi:MAG: hypothetical protein H6705_21570, partial [Myxococcales bacterium]|nr:hypothetical protein [Myxococcales bacterium]